MNKHFIKPGFVAAVGLGMMLIFMSLEAKAEPLNVEAEAHCYGAATLAEKYDDAKRHRLNLSPFQDEQQIEIVYHTAYGIGYLTAIADVTGLPVATIAASWHLESCLEKT